MSKLATDTLLNFSRFTTYRSTGMLDRIDNLETRKRVNEDNEASSCH